MNIADVLSVGKDHSISREYLKQLLNISDRELYSQVARERIAGAVILTDGHGGLYLADQATANGQAEIRQFEMRMLSMARNTVAATNGAWLADKRHREESIETT